MGAVEYVCEVTDDWFWFCHSEKHTVIYNPPQIIDAYFAEKKIVDIPIGGSQDDEYIVKRGDSLSKIAKKYKGISYPDIAKANSMSYPYRILVGQRIKIPNGKKKTKKETQYKKIESTNLGSKVYLVAKTKYFENGDNITFKIYEDSKMLVDNGAELPVLKNHSEKTEIKGSVTNKIKKYTEEDTYCSVDDDKYGEVAIEIELRPKDDTLYEEWKKKLKGKEDKLYLKVFSSKYENLNEKEFLVGKELVVKYRCLTLAQLTSIFPNADATRREEVLNVFNEYCNDFQINTPLRVAHFFAQVKEEVGSTITYQTENLNYAATALGRIFSYFRRHPDEATLYGRTRLHPANQEAIANRVYANRIGNGNIASGDGWRFRGKGFIQLTGRANYQSANDEIQRYASRSGIDIIQNPESILTIEGAMVSSMGYWIGHNLNNIADNAGWNRENVDNITDVVNSGTDSREDRKEHFDAIKDILNIEE